MDVNNAELSSRLDAITRVSERALSRLSEVRGVGRVGDCTAIVDSRGHLVDIQFLTSATALDRNGLATLVLRAYREACTSADKSASAIVDALRKHPDIIASGVGTDTADARNHESLTDDDIDIYDYRSNSWRSAPS